MPSSSALRAPERNRYFYGLLMDAERFQKDQNYFNRKLGILGALGFGSGVLCGLNLTYDGKTLALAPGVAIDAAGRQIVVPAVTTVDVTQVTDDKGQPTGPVPAGTKTLSISIIYAEKNTDAAPVLVTDCDHPNGCAPSTIEEGYAIVVSAVDLAAFKAVTPGCANRYFLLPPSPQSAAAIATRVSQSCPSMFYGLGVPLGTFDIAGNSVDPTTRDVVYNNDLLFDLITCLAVRVSEIAGPWQLVVYVSGNNQHAAASTVLANPLTVASFNVNGQPITDGGPPTFTVTQGGGSVTAPASIGNDQYQVTWTLGSSGTQQVTATLGGFNVVFDAAIQ